ncbi:MAG: 2OG-Fe(II) oxygenase [Hyphomicrobiaceae bacterium]
MRRQRTPTSKSFDVRIRALDWGQISSDLDAFGAATIGPVLTPTECEVVAAGFMSNKAFRKHIVMQKHGFGRGEYKYWDYPLPAFVGGLRNGFYPRLAKLANIWQAALGNEQMYPPTLADYLERCHEAGQLRPTPLLLKYGVGDYNCLHQDLYGDHAFPLQIAILLSEPGQDFEGGEFVVTEQRPRMQSRAEVIALRQGQAVVFACNSRPVIGNRGTYRVKMRHGVSRIRQGVRYTMGLIFHDAA